MKKELIPSTRVVTPPGKAVVYYAAFIVIAAAFCSVTAVFAADGSPDDALGPAMALMNEKKFAEAKKMLREALRKDPSSELLWVSYDSCVRSEMLCGTQTAEANKAFERPDGPDITAGRGTELSPGATAEVITSDEAFKTERSAAASYDSDADGCVYEADFSKGAASGSLACLLNDTFKFISADGRSYLMAGAKGRGASVSFTFNISKFPKKVKLAFTHRLVKKDRFLSEAPLLIEVNEKKINYDAIKLGNRLETTEFDVTNASKEGANIITLNADAPKHPYLLQSVKVTLCFRD